MSVLAAVVIGLAMGAVFGFALEKSRVFEPGMIVGQMQLRNFTMLKVFLAAVATGLVVLGALHAFGFIKLSPKATVYGANIVGGLVLGAGIALAGACPGTVLAQVGAGYKDAWFTLAGGLAGAAAFVYFEPQLKPILLSGGPGKLTLHELSGIPFWALALGFAVIWVAMLFALEQWRPWREDIGAVDFADGTPTMDAVSTPPEGGRHGHGNEALRLPAVPRGAIRAGEAPPFREQPAVRQHHTGFAALCRKGGGARG